MLLNMEKFNEKDLEAVISGLCFVNDKLFINTKEGLIEILYGNVSVKTYIRVDGNKKRIVSKINRTVQKMIYFDEYLKS